MNNKRNKLISAVAAIDSGLDLDKRGPEAGTANLPAPGSTMPDAHEVDIHATYLGLAHQACEELEAEWQATSHEQQEAASQLVREDPDAFVVDTEQTIRLTQARHKASLERSAQGYWRSKRELLGFRERHGLQRLTVHPESLSFHVGALLFLVVIESIANGLVIGRLTPGGIAYGIGLATTLAAANIVVAFAFGRIVRGLGLFHRNPLRKISALGALILFLVFLGAFHLLIAHLREAMEHAFASGSVDAVLNGDAYRQAVQRFLEAPFEIFNFQGWMLILVGVGFAASAFFAGLELKDLYPGFSGVEARHFKSSEVAHARVLSYLGDMMEGIETQVTNVETYYHGVASMVGQQQQLFLVKQHLVETAKRKLQELGEGYQVTIGKYRALNMAFRTEPPPSFFQEPVIAPDAFDPDVRLADYNERLATEEETLGKLVEMKEGLRDKLLGARDKIAQLQERATKDGTRLVIAHQEENALRLGSPASDGEEPEPAMAG